MTYHRRRSSPRRSIHASAEVKCSAVPGTHVGLVRDVSRHGIFFFSDFKPPIGSRLDLALAGADRLSYQATVVRVEQVAPGAAPGIAARLSTQAFEEPENTELC